MFPPSGPSQPAGQAALNYPAGPVGYAGVTPATPQGAAPTAAPQPGQPVWPYNMPGTSGKPGPWAGGGPVGSGVVPVDVEAQVLSSFAEQTVRKGFMRKVFALVAIQLAVCVGFALVCNFVTPIKSYVRSTPWPFYMSWGLSFGLLLVISSNERLRRRAPVNLVFLAAFTVCMAFLVGMITAFFDFEAVLLAFLTTAVAVAVLAGISMTRLDITSWGTLLVLPSILVVVLVLIGVFWVSRWLYLVIAGIAALLSSVYIVYDLQLIMGGKQYAISPDEYVFAALSLYLDIVQLFIWVLYLIGLSGER